MTTTPHTDRARELGAAKLKAEGWRYIEDCEIHIRREGNRIEVRLGPACAWDLWTIYREDAKRWLVVPPKSSATPEAKAPDLATAIDYVTINAERSY